METETELERAFSLDCNAALKRCFRRIGSWRVPPNWSVVGWREEIRAHGLAAASQASCDYDPARGVPFAGFVYRRVLARAYSRYRQEWTYGLRYIPQTDDMVADRSSPSPRGRSHTQYPVSEIGKDLNYQEIHEALQCLPERDRQLMVYLFWKRRTETDIAAALGVSHQAISKRKRTVLLKLRERIRVSKEKERRFSC